MKPIKSFLTALIFLTLNVSSSELKEKHEDDEIIVDFTQFFNMSDDVFEPRDPATLPQWNSTRQLKALLMDDYDKQEPPKRSYNPNATTVVHLGVYITSFDSIDEANMDFTLSMYLRQSWRDERLQFRPAPGEKLTRVVVPLWDDIWVPDVYFRNEKAAHFHDVTTPNKLLTIQSDGMIWYASRVSASLYCPMDLHDYPFDTQICPITFESFSHTTRVVDFRFLQKNPVETEHEIRVPFFELRGWQTSTCTQTYLTGTFSCLAVSFKLSREYGTYVTQIFLPSTLYVSLSWIGFWIHADAVPARCMICMLATVALSVALTNSKNTRVSYVMAVDIWFITCLMFVLLAFIEYAIVNTAIRTMVQKQLCTCDQTKEKKKKRKDERAAGLNLRRSYKAKQHEARQMRKRLNNRVMEKETIERITDEQTLLVEPYTASPLTTRRGSYRNAFLAGPDNNNESGGGGGVRHLYQRNEYTIDTPEMRRAVEQRRPSGLRDTSSLSRIDHRPDVYLANTGHSIGMLKRNSLAGLLNENQRLQVPKKESVGVRGGHASGANSSLTVDTINEAGDECGGDIKPGDGGRPANGSATRDNTEWYEMYGGGIVSGTITPTDTSDDADECPQHPHMKASCIPRDSPGMLFCLDQYSRFLFPGMFIMFLTGYFSFYLVTWPVALQFWKRPNHVFHHDDEKPHF